MQPCLRAKKKGVKQMKFKISIISLLIVLFALCSMGQSGCFNLDVLKPKPPPPVGEFQGDWWLDGTSTAIFGELTMEEREDGVYMVFPAGIIPEGTLTLTFTDGTVLTGHLTMTWGDRDIVRLITEVDPETGAPLRAIGTGSFPWEMYSETGEMLFIGTGTIVERHFVFQDGQVIEQEDIQPAILKANGVGPYKGYTLTSEVKVNPETRDGKPGQAFYGAGVIEKM